jgi:hypothetical protein
MMQNSIKLAIVIKTMGTKDVLGEGGTRGVDPLTASAHHAGVEEGIIKRVLPDQRSSRS